MQLLAEAMQHTADQLAAAGMRVTTNPAAVNPPCAVVDPPQLDRLTGSSWSATVTVYLVAAGGVGSAAAVEQLDQLLTLAVAALDPDTVRPVTYTLGATETPAPALQLQMERTVE